MSAFAVGLAPTSAAAAAVRAVPATSCVCTCTSAAAARQPASAPAIQRTFMGQALLGRPRRSFTAAGVDRRSRTPAAVPAVSASSPAVDQAKKKLLDLIAPVERGLTATKEQEAAIEQATRELEALNPTPVPTSSTDLEGDWELIYTTSESIIGRTRPGFARPKGPIYQKIRLADTSVENSETIEPLPFVKVTNKVRATFTVDGPVRVQVKFNEFEIGGVLRFKAGENARGFLETTFLDGTMRVSRGNRNNLFVLVK